MSIQVVVTLEDKQWSSIRPELEQALFRVTEHMDQPIHGEKVQAVARNAAGYLLFGGTGKACVELLEKEGFSVEVKDLNQ